MAQDAYAKLSDYWKVNSLVIFAHGSYRVFSLFSLDAALFMQIKQYVKLLRQYLVEKVSVILLRNT